MRDYLGNIWSAFCGIWTAGVSTTLLSINLLQLLGWAQFCGAAFIGGLIGFFAKKFGEFCWAKLFNRERIPKIDPTGERTGDQL